MKVQKKLVAVCAALTALPALAVDTVTPQPVLTDSETVNTGASRDDGKIRLFNDLVTVEGELRVRGDKIIDPEPDRTDSHFNANVWLRVKPLKEKDWEIVTQLEPQINLKTGKFNGDHDVPMNKLYLEGTVYGKVKARAGKYGAFSSYGRVFDNEVTGGELFFDYRVPVKVAAGRLTKHLNDNPFGIEVRREKFAYAQASVPVSENVNVGATVAYVDDIKRRNGSAKGGVFGELGADAKFGDFQTMLAVSKSNIKEHTDFGKKIANEGVLTQVRYKQADWAVRNSWDVYANYRRVGFLSGVSSVEDYSKNVQGFQLGANWIPYKNFKVGAFYLTGKEVTPTAGNDKRDVNVVRGQVEYKF